MKICERIEVFFVIFLFDFFDLFTWRRMESELLGLHRARGERSHQVDLKDLQDPVELLSFQSPQTSGRLQGA